MSNTIKTVYLVGCGKAKLDVAAPAKDLYQGALFKKARAYVEHKMVEGDEWFILSALERCIRPDEVIHPYDKTLQSMSPASRYEWSMGVVKDLASYGQYPTRQNVEYVFLCGKLYRDVIIKFFDEYRPFSPTTIRVPMEGLGIGQQLKWLTDEVNR